MWTVGADISARDVQHSDAKLGLNTEAPFAHVLKEMLPGASFYFFYLFVFHCNRKNST